MGAAFWLTLVLGLVLLAICLLGGLLLWWPSRHDREGRIALGQALWTGALLAVVGLLIQLRATHEDHQRQRAADRDAFRLTVTTAKDLKFADLSGRDLSGFYLGGKDFH